MNFGIMVKLYPNPDNPEPKIGYRGPLLHDQCHIGAGHMPVINFLIVLSKTFRESD
uniref:Uncharacterized protein n=1 Tax=Candidatus Kentrum sp. MB TaxID=2138164 RepID=A0A451BAZ3_9GAMM|nr:MAG: hypothetical protein BECKMB1821I_GA0114274_102223 [Candidatus Kentron sp. MB]VFK75447.1 MAG: hypothetical protein BECKMB1821H_GA0114242_102223 [Candidatus Kentron sp. MB]